MVFLKVWFRKKSVILQQIIRMFYFNQWVQHFHSSIDLCLKTIIVDVFLFDPVCWCLLLMFIVDVYCCVFHRRSMMSLVIQSCMAKKYRRPWPPGQGGGPNPPDPWQVRLAQSGFWSWSWVMLYSLIVQMVLKVSSITFFTCLILE